MHLADHNVFQKNYMNRNTKYTGVCKQTLQMLKNISILSLKNFLFT